MKPWEGRFLFQIRRAFARLFFHQGKSAKKGRYGAVSLESMSSAWNDETESAVVSFQGELEQDTLTSTYLTNEIKEQLVIELSSALKILKRVTGEHTDKVQTLIDVFDSAVSIKDKSVALQTHGHEVVHALEIARSMKAIETPRLGGVTRWGFDKICSIEFLSTQLPTVAKWALDQIRNQKKPAPSLVKLCELLGRPNAVTVAMDEAKHFLKDMEPLHKVLIRFSDYGRQPLATSVYASVEDVRVCGVTLAAQGQKEFSCAFEHHAARLLDRHDMRFWEKVRWLHPLVLSASKRGGHAVPTSQEMSKALQIDLNPEEWEKYSTCLNYKWEKSMSHEGEWWSSIGGDMFPLMKKSALSLIWVPTVVTQCDGMLSVMGAKFNKRQARLSPHVAANQIFMRCNSKYLLGPSHEEDMTDTSSSDDEVSEDG